MAGSVSPVVVSAIVGKVGGTVSAGAATINTPARLTLTGFDDGKVSEPGAVRTFKAFMEEDEDTAAAALGKVGMRYRLL